ncbi:MAG: glycosyltransferase family 4 protein [Actinomycetota bacterium]
MGDRPRVLLTVSGPIPETLDADVADRRRPRADYRVMADAMGADVVDTVEARRASGPFGRLLERSGPGPLLAWYCWRHRSRYDVILTDGEQVGLPFAALCRLARRRPQHAMIVHIVSTSPKRRVIRFGGLARAIDRWLVYSSRQAEIIRDDVGVDADRVELTTFMVDTDFFAESEVATPAEGGRPVISSAGLERRDYPTLLAAVEGLDVDVVIAAASPWSTKADSTEGQHIPDNVEIRRLDLFELRELYARSAFVVMPLVEVEFQAGITTILEAMAMSRAVVCTRTTGQTDTIVEGSTGRYVPPADVEALRSAIVDLIDDDAERRRLGDEARRWVVAHADIDVYAERLARSVAAVAELAD